MKILLTGAAGMLSSDVIPEIQKAKHKLVLTDIHQRLPDIEALDVRNIDEVFDFVKKVNPEYIFHLAAETNVDLCEKDSDHAFQVNTVGTENIALACQEFGIKLMYISTAGVFYGQFESG